MKQSAHGSAPARANLLGEHTDYNFGYVMPTPLRYKTDVRVERTNDNEFRAKSIAFKDDYVFKAGGNLKGAWTDYLSGCVSVLKDAGHDVPSFSFLVDSNVPMGMGMSSSAALTVSTLRALCDVLDIDYSDVEIAKLAHNVETKYVGVPCGIMDQMVCATGKVGQAMFLDTKTMQTEYIDLPEGYRFCILHSGISHELKEGDGGYKQRVAECAKACELLGVSSLREVDETMTDAINKLPEPLNKRARHVVTENARVLAGVKALKAHDIATYGRLMIESHKSQRDDYEVSVSKIDAIVEAALKHGAIGARLTGGGFGGSVIALVKDELVEEWWDNLSKDVKGITLL